MLRSVALFVLLISCCATAQGFVLWYSALPPLTEQDLEAIRAGARGIFDEAFLIAIGMHVILTAAMWARGRTPSEHEI